MTTSEILAGFPSLLQGQYIFEAWGAKGGDSAGSSYGDRTGSSTVQGGLGGYSCGNLRLNKNETGHYSNYTAVLETGGGFTSIRIESDTNYSRVIVTGGGNGVG